MMAEARDAGATGVPFVAGIALGTAILPNIEHSAIFSLTLMFFISGLAVLELYYGKTFRETSLIFFSTAVFMLTGIFCAVNSSVCIFHYTGTGAGHALDSMKSVIDGIPYPDSTSAPLVKALLTGDRSSLPAETAEIFRQSGASHILALSGLHLGIIYLIISKATIPAGNNPAARKAVSILTIILCGFYSVTAGASPSLIRAFLFIFLNETAKILKRKVRPLGLLAAAATIQLALNPSSITSVSFQLSYSAISGIFLLFPFLKSFYPSSGNAKNPLRWIWESAALSISCQVFTAPVAWYYFRSFPEYFLLANLIALPLTSAIMVLSITTIALSAAGLCPYFLIIANDAAIQAILFCLGIISGMSAP